jgi:hypothetical protein
MILATSRRDPADFEWKEMRTTIASSEIFGLTPAGERKRLTIAVGTPGRRRQGEGWQCKVVIADVLRPTAIAGVDSFQALARALAYLRQYLERMGQEGWELSSDRDGRETLDIGSWLAPPG